MSTLRPDEGGRKRDRQKENIATMRLYLALDVFYAQSVAHLQEILSDMLEEQTWENIRFGDESLTEKIKDARRSLDWALTHESFDRNRIRGVIEPLLHAMIGALDAKTTTTTPASAPSNSDTRTKVDTVLSSPSPVGQGFYSAEEAAERLGVSVEEINGMAQRREIRAFADRGTWRFRAQDIEEMIRQRGAAKPTETPTAPAEDTARDSGTGSGHDLDLFAPSGLESSDIHSEASQRDPLDSSVEFELHPSDLDSSDDVPLGGDVGTPPDDNGSGILSQGSQPNSPDSGPDFDLGPAAAPGPSSGIFDTPLPSNGSTIGGVESEEARNRRLTKLGAQLQRLDSAVTNMHEIAPSFRSALQPFVTRLGRLENAFHADGSYDHREAMQAMEDLRAEASRLEAAMRGASPVLAERARAAQEVITEALDAGLSEQEMRNRLQQVVLPSLGGLIRIPFPERLVAIAQALDAVADETDWSPFHGRFGLVVPELADRRRGSLREFMLNEEQNMIREDNFFTWESLEERLRELVEDMRDGLAQDGNTVPRAMRIPIADLVVPQALSTPTSPSVPPLATPVPVPRSAANDSSSGVPQSPPPVAELSSDTGEQSPNVRVTPRASKKTKREIATNVARRAARESKEYLVELEDSIVRRLNMTRKKLYGILAATLLAGGGLLWGVTRDWSGGKDENGQAKKPDSTQKASVPNEPPRRVHPFQNKEELEQTHKKEVERAKPHADGEFYGKFTRIKKDGDKVVFSAEGISLERIQVFVTVRKDGKNVKSTNVSKNHSEIMSLENGKIVLHLQELPEPYKSAPELHVTVAEAPDQKWVYGQYFQVRP